MFVFLHSLAEVLQLTKDVANEYLGSHNFHNFTSGKKFTDPSARRHMLSIDVSKLDIRFAMIYLFYLDCGSVHSRKCGIYYNYHQRTKFYASSNSKDDQCVVQLNATDHALLF